MGWMLTYPKRQQPIKRRRKMPGEVAVYSRPKELTFEEYLNQPHIRVGVLSRFGRIVFFNG